MWFSPAGERAGRAPPDIGSSVRGSSSTYEFISPTARPACAPELAVGAVAPREQRGGARRAGASPALGARATTDCGTHLSRGDGESPRLEQVRAPNDLKLLLMRAIVLLFAYGPSSCPSPPPTLTAALLLERGSTALLDCVLREEADAARGCSSSWSATVGGTARWLLSGYGAPLEASALLYRLELANSARG